MYPGSDNPWKEFFQFCDEKSAKPKADYGKTTWEWANKKIIFKLSGKNPPALEPIPDYLWAEGNGLCTSFAIEVNEATATHGGYVEYASKHRAVQKTIGADVLLIDSSVGMAIQLKEDAEFEKWHHVESGKVSWDKA
ncbi:hypothetical protein BDV95DRAFT_590231 [Massariosphaeria phaeospora]|uniref:Uncharacterized protein n=1 Tax=Massariosphaeria phaeospora TaxID=100035 RepID=A0A7C8MHJ2_9PLEO|nr:hypothetical protein BDV95DRAFT_590231 [Massariosphaeria phaeospora]